MTNRLTRFFQRLTGTQKQYNTLYPSTWGAGGAIGRNRDIIWNKWGASLAVTVNEATYRCVTLRAETVGATKWKILDNATNEVLAQSSDIETQNALARALMRYEKRTQKSIFYRWELSRVVTGENYVELARNDYGYPADVEWLNPLGMNIIAPYGVPTQFIYALYGKSETFTPETLVYDRLSTNLQDEIYGYSPVMTAIGSKTLDISRNSQRVLSAFFVNDATPHNIITPPATNGGDFGNTGWSQQQVDRITMQLRQQNLGVDSAYKTSLFPFPIDYKQLELPELDKWSELLRSIEPRIYTVLGVPRSVAGDSDSTRYQASPDDVPNFNKTIVNELRAIEIIMNARLVPFFTAMPKPPYRFEFDYSAYETVNLENAQLASQAFRDGAITLNEYRRQIGQENLPNGDVLLTDSTFIFMPVNDIGKVTPEPLAVLPQVESEPTPTPQTQDNITAQPQKAVPEKYSHIDFTPTDEMKTEAERALAWRKEFGRGGTGVGIARARDIANKRNLSPETVRRMKAYFDRHEVDKRAEGFEPGEKGYPSNGRIAWGLWGGDAGYSWARKRVTQMNTADNAEKAKELRAWYNKARGKGASKAVDFIANVIPDDDASEIRYYLALGDDSVFKRFRAIYDETPEHYADERIEALVASYRGMLKEAHDTLGVHADEHAVKRFHLSLIRAKSIQATRLSFENAVEDLFLDALDNTVNKRTFKMRLFALIRVWGYQAYKDGLKVGGIDVVDLDGDDLTDYERFLEEQRQFVDNVAEAIYTDNRVTEDEAKGKPLMWSNKSLMPFYYMGVESASANGAFEWVLGRTEEHCVSCKALDGQVRRMKYWQSTVMPQASSLRCSGFNCKCLLIKTNRNISRGRLPNWG